MPEILHQGRSFASKLSLSTDLLHDSCGRGYSVIHFQALYMIKSGKEHLKNIMGRSRLVFMYIFKFNRYSEQNALAEFRCQTSKILNIAGLMSSHRQPTKHCRYWCGNISATCIVLLKLALLSLRYDIDKVFRMHYSKMREVFLEEIECFWNP